MKMLFHVSVITLTAMMMTSCATQSAPTAGGERLRHWEYDVHVYQPPCHVVTTKHASGTVLGQYTQCPAKQYYCTLKSTGNRITCPKFNQQNFEEDYGIVENSHDKEDCRIVGEYNRHRPKNQWLTITSPEKNPHCNQYGMPK